MTDLAYRAMEFAFLVHATQVRKYTNNPYTDHLAQVAGIVAAIDNSPETIAAAWLHDCREDQGITGEKLEETFGSRVAGAVALLSDFEVGTRTERKAAACTRLAQAPGWVQNIKCADLISNTSSIVQHDPKFAVLYLAEKRAMLAVMSNAHPNLLHMASTIINIPK